MNGNPFFPLCFQTINFSAFTIRWTNDHRDYLWKVLAKGKMASLECKRHFSWPRVLMGKQLFIAGWKNLSLQGIPVETAIWRRNGSADVSVSGIVDAWLTCSMRRGRWFVLCCVMLFRCSHDGARACVGARRATCKCDSFAHPQSGIK